VKLAPTPRAIEWGNARVGRLFKEMDVPLTIVLNAARN
jgi:hypothetical protein